MSPASTYARASTWLSLCSSQAGTCHPDRALVTHRVAPAACPSARPRHGGYQPGQRPDQLVRARAQGGVRLLEETACVAHLIALQHVPRPGRPAPRGSAARPPCWPWPPGRPTPRRSPASHARPLPARDSPRQSARCVLGARRRCGRHPRIEGTDRLVKMARPQLNYPAGGQEVGAYRRMPGEDVTRDPGGQRLGAGCGRRGQGEITRLPGARPDGGSRRPAGLGSPRPAGRRARMVSAVVSAAAQRFTPGRRPARRGGTRYGWGSSQASLSGMLRNSLARDWPRCGPMISVIARSSMTMLAASCQSPALAACRTALVSEPFCS